METTIVGYIGMYIGIMEKKMETTILPFTLRSRPTRNSSSLDRKVDSFRCIS